MMGKASKKQQNLFNESLSEVVTEDIRKKQGKKTTPKDENSYNRFFVNAFSKMNLDALVDEGGADSLEAFKSKAGKYVADQGYWDRMFNGTFTGRDGQIKKSNFNRLGDAIYESKIAPLRDDRVETREYSIIGKTKTFFYVKKAVRSGQSVEFGSKIYKGGQFLPKDFRR